MKFVAFRPIISLTLKYFGVILPEHILISVANDFRFILVDESSRDSDWISLFCKSAGILGLVESEYYN